ncbi:MULTISPECIES: hypothetical protein [Brucella/Ochrobactrum group]|uniref:Uncharacterized protein n=2 Tax=Brucella/Ochrobactrum group TaxID=2826938 RepID=A0ABY5U9T7_9HYPH|nr:MULTISPECIES: hypothetical protein [Brucella/Ochrobactrum group]UWL60110.1 hypothetical protein NIK97_11415 [Brucella pseudintermedia]WPM80531.1 hypothetical protein R5W60_02050 [Brucella pseudintermedia]
MMYPRVSPAGATLLLAVAMALPAGSAFAKSACDGVTTTLTRQVKSDYRSLIARSLGKKVKPASVNIESFMQYGNWSVVYADVPVADPGYFFFDLSGKSPELKDVWGGMAERSEMPDLVKWAEKLGANKEIAACFADRATAS